MTLSGGILSTRPLYLIANSGAPSASAVDITRCFPFGPVSQTLFCLLQVILLG